MLKPGGSPSGVRAVVAIATLTLLAACAGTAELPAERPTSSDQTDVDRRSRMRLELASAYFGRGQAETALDEVKQALAIRPNFGEAFNLRGLIYASLGDDRLAEDSFQRALQLNARDADAAHNYGWFLCQRQRMPEAMAQFQRAMAVPQYAGVSRTLLAQGVCQARAGQWAEAERSLSKAYELDPSSPVTAVNLAEVLLRRGELERARFYVRRVNMQPEASNAQTLWLAARIERRLGNEPGVRDFGTQLRNRFPQSPEALRYERGQFDD